MPFVTADDGAQIFYKDSVRRARAPPPIITADGEGCSAADHRPAPPYPPPTPQRRARAEGTRTGPRESVAGVVST